MSRILTGKIITLLLSAALLCSITACRTIRPERPTESYLPADFHPAWSEINIPVKIEIKKLETALNKQLQGLIYADTSFDDHDHDNLMIKAWKKSDITLSLDGNQISSSVPLKIWIKKRLVIGSFGISVSDEKEVTGEILLKFKTRITLNNDWTFSPHTTSGGFEWLSAPVLKIGPVTFPITVIMDLLLPDSQKEVNKEIDKAIRSFFDLKKVVRQAWIDVQTPVNLGKGDYPLWIRIIPSETRTAPIQGSAGSIGFLLGIRAMFELFLGNEPSYNVNEELPDIKITSRLDENLSLNILVDLPFSSINQVARQNLIGYQINEGSYHLTVDDVSLYGSADKLLVSVKLTGSLNGTIYLSGKPLYDKSTSTLIVKDLDYDVSTRNVLVKSASWIFHHDIRKIISAKLVYPVGDQLRTTRQELQSFLDNNGKIDILKLDGKIGNMNIDDIRITRESVKALFSFTGNLNVSIEP